EDNVQAIVFLTPDNKYQIIAGNFNEEPREVTIQLKDKFLNVMLAAHSFHTFYM
ncbi:hypothetical protein EVA_02101, partial [gut metagenome]